VCCLPKAGANCRPGDEADLVKLAKQVESLAHQASDSDHDKSTGKSSGSKNDDDGDHDNDHDNGGHGGGAGGTAKGHDKSGCWHAG
jgi:hypothetical protein